LVEAITRLSSEPETTRVMGENGRETFLAAFERSQCCSLWSGVIGDLLTVPRRSTLAGRRASSPVGLRRATMPRIAGGSV
jgi:hypothetical protein